jgi:acetyltransferase-like isoleucine patch superfamily enzyme
MIHPSAIVHETAVVHETAQVWQFAHIMNGVVLSEGVSVGGNSEIGRFSFVGAFSRIGFGVFLPNRSRIGSRVFIGPNVTFCDDKYPYVANPRYHAQPPIIEDNASIGAGATILPGVTVGKYAVVGAGAVVTKDVLPDTTVVGNPARDIRS